MMERKTPTPVVADATHFYGYGIAVLVPCYNEEVTVATVVRDFRAALPTATIFVFNNNSTDNAAAAARAAGADAPFHRRAGVTYPFLP